MIISKRTKTKYLTVQECEQIQQQIETILNKYGLNVKTVFHPTYIEVPTKEEVQK